MKNIFSVANKIAVITGASSGLGHHFAKTLAKAGATVVIAARRLDKLDAVANEIISQRGTAFPIYLDVTDQANVQQFVQKVENEVGKIDILINNAGIDIPNKNFFEHDEHDWDLIFNTNLKGVCMVSQAVAKHMLNHKKSGSIINITSATDVLTYTGGSPAYMASKAGVSHLTHALALELAPTIRVNAIAPGGFLTEMSQDLIASEYGKLLEKKVPLLRYGELTDLDGVLLLLASDASRYMTGCIVRVDGGLAINKVSV